MAHSKNLDDWMHRRSALLTQDATQKRTSKVREETQQHGRNFLWSELGTGRQFAKLARTSKGAPAIARRRQAARKAYDTLLHYLSRTSFPKSELKSFREELQEFKRELEQLGEVFKT